MSSIYGIFSRNKKSVKNEELALMGSALSHWEADHSGSFMEGVIGMGCLMLHNTPESVDEKLPFNAAYKSLSITADACLYNREDLFQKLSIASEAQKGLADSALILAAYKKWGEDCPSHLLGDFAFAIWDKRERKLFCARDQMGVRPFFYYMSDKTFAFASENKGLLALPEIPRDPDHLWMADYICGVHMEKENSFYKEILRLPPAHTLTVTAGDIKKRRYWDFDLGREMLFQKEEDYFEAFREGLENAVKVRLRTHRHVGSELTGGLDSSVVASLADRMLKEEGKRVYTFSHASPVGMAGKEGFMPDERRFVDMILEYTGMNKHCYVFNREKRGLFEIQERAFKMQSGVAQSDFATSGWFLFEEAQKKEVGLILSGLGGDHIPSSHGPGFYQELADSGQWKEIVKELRATRKRKGGNLFKSIIATFLDVRAPCVGNALRRLSGKKNLKSDRTNTSLLKCRDLGIPGLSEFVDSVDMKGRINHQMDLMGKLRTVREREYHMISNAHLTTRVECGSISTGSMKMEYRYPLLDVPLLEFSLAIPARMKRKNGWGRYVYRKSVEGLIPPGVQWEENKFGFLFPWWQNSLSGEEGRPFPAPPADAAEEVKFYYKIFKSVPEEAKKVHQKQMDMLAEREKKKGAAGESVQRKRAS